MNISSLLRCAKLAKRKGHRYIGLQAYSECWSGDPTADLFRYPAKAGKCWGFRPNFGQCDDDGKTECVGTKRHNYIYELYDGDGKLHSLRTLTRAILLIKHLMAFLEKTPQIHRLCTRTDS